MKTPTIATTNKNTMSVITGYILTTDDNGEYVVDLKSGEYRTPNSRYLITDTADDDTNAVDTFVSRVQNAAKSMVATTIRNDLTAINTAIDDALTNTAHDVATITDLESRRDTLTAYLDTFTYDADALSDNVAVVVAYVIVRPKYARFNRYNSSTAVLDTIRRAYDATADGVKVSDITATRKAVRDAVLEFVAPYLTPDAADVSIIYKNIKPRLSLEETRQLIDTIGAYTLKWSKSGITSRRINDNAALVQLFLYTLRVCFDIAVVPTVKVDNNSYQIF